VTRFLVDLNIVLDVLLERIPHAEAAGTVWACVETRMAEGFLAAHHVTTLHYLVERARDLAAAAACVEGVLSVFRVAPVDEAVLRAASALSWPDFEDAITAAAAGACGCHAIVTRDARGFRGARLPVLAATEAVAAIRVG
jgi:predicted nucleic acid-binding protein